MAKTEAGMPIISRGGTTQDSVQAVAAFLFVATMLFGLAACSQSAAR